MVQSTLLLMCYMVLSRLWNPIKCHISFYYLSFSTTKKLNLTLKEVLCIYKALILRTVRSGYIIIGTFCQLMNTLSTLQIILGNFQNFTAPKCTLLYSLSLSNHHFWLRFLCNVDTIQTINYLPGAVIGDVWMTVNLYRVQ